MYILHGILFFSWFISFAIFNVNSLEWGLQVSWFLSILFCIYSVVLFLVNNRLNITINIADKIFFIILIITLFNYLLFYLNGQDDIESYLFGIKYKYSFVLLRNRSIPHLLYIIFLWFTVKNIIIYFSYYPNRCQNWIKKYFITFPFFFIGIWAIYQWLSTYDIVPYTTVFNNNLSTGFTYLRFKDAHRSSSVFPEPSEYAYFLAFYLPFVLSFLFGEKNMFSILNNRISKCLLLLFYLFQIFICKSMSLFIMFPLIFLYSINTVLRKRRFIMNLIYFFLIAIFGVFVYMHYGQRLRDVISGIDSSMLIRIRGLYEGFALFVASPITGFGYGVIRGLDLFSFLLACFGIIGTFLLLLCMHKLKQTAKNNEISKLFYHGLISMIIVAMISNPILEYIMVWIILAIIIFFGKKQNIIYNNR